MNMFYPQTTGVGMSPSQPQVTTGNNQNMYVQDPNQSLIRMPYITPPPQTQHLLAIPGRVINNPDEVKPNEIPNDGSFGVFPMADQSAIYLKCWGSEGLIKTIKYVQAVEVDPILQPPNMTDLSEEIAQIKAALTDIQSQLRNKKPHYHDNRQKKGGNE